LLAPRRRAAISSLVATVVASASLPSLASAGVLAPDSTASDGIGSARTLYVVMAVVAVLLVLAVLGAVARALRSTPDGDQARRTRGSGARQLRVGIGLGAAAIVLFVVGIIFTEKTTSVDAADGAEPITIKVDGQQWLWRYEYPAEQASPDGFSSDTPYSYHRLVVPVDTPVTLEISSIDVMHRWGVPALAPVVDAVPGATTEVTFTATETGTYEGSSRRFSGPGYATMRTVVEVVEPAEYEAFLDEKRTGIKDARGAVQQRIDEGKAPGVEFEEQ
jgi:cytochrome c oxidase subunit II